MTDLRFLSASALILALAACAPEAEPVEAPEEGAPAAETTDAGPGDEALGVLEIAARDVCAAGDDGFAALLPDGTGFASRGPDARVHAAWNLDGETGEAIIATPDLEMEERTVFDFAVADFLRHNMVAGFDRTGLTGAFRYRDGRFCVVQAEREVIEALRDAVQAAQ
ncbi:hypothetical protein NHF40_12615 [Maricaulaceae bacterium EIL42A08]|nr:hypothetical protein [Maricaulaceae bacterium EIL42A08]